MPRFNHRSDWNRANNGRTALYRLYKADGELLYIGISNNPEKRWRFHAADKPWWHWVARRDVTWLDSRQEALDVEEQATLKERPRFGDTARLGKGWHTTERSEVDSGIQAEADHLTAVLRGQIADGIHAPGARLVRSRLAEQHGVSKALVGMALLHLSREGLVREVDQRASVVVPQTTQQ